MDDDDDDAAPVLGLSARAMIVDGFGRVLLLRRRAGQRHWPGEWELPGGKPEPGEDWLGALQRETLEETGLRIVVEGLVGAAEHDLPGRGGGDAEKGIRLIVLVLRCRMVDADAVVRLSAEHEELVWADASALGTMAIVAPQRRAMGVCGVPDG